MWDVVKAGSCSGAGTSCQAKLGHRIASAASSLNLRLARSTLVLAIVQPFGPSRRRSPLACIDQSSASAPGAKADCVSHVCKYHICGDICRKRQLILIGESIGVHVPRRLTLGLRGDHPQITLTQILATARLRCTPPLSGSMSPGRRGLYCGGIWPCLGFRVVVVC